jgi:Rrf2 family protein
MKLTLTSVYALRTLALMSEEKDSSFTSIELHKRLGIPKKYLQRLLTQLVKAGLIRSVRGRGGGIELARSPSRIFLAEIIEAAEGPQRQPECFLGYEKCPLKRRCAMHEVWAESQKRTQRQLARVSLAKLFPKKKVT